MGGCIVKVSARQATVHEYFRKFEWEDDLGLKDNTSKIPVFRVEVLGFQPHLCS